MAIEANPLPNANAALTVTTGLKAIIFAGGSGSRLSPLVTPQVPKALLPVANRQALAHSLECLSRANISDITVIVSGEFSDAVSAYVKTCAQPINIIISENDISDDTADILRENFPKPQYPCDYVVLSCDIIGELPIADIIRQHRKSRSSATVVLRELDTADTETPSSYVVLDSTEKRLLAVYYESDVQGEFKIRRSLLQRFPQLRMRPRISDLHAYVISSDIVAEISHDISSVKYDLIPHIVRRQFRMKHTISSYFLKNHSFVTRVNNIPALIAANIQLAKPAPSSDGSSHNNKNKKGGAKDKKGGGKPDKKQAGGAKGGGGGGKGKSNVGADCLVGQRVTMGERTSVKKSVVGDDTTLGNQVKLNGCVVAANVTIEDSVNLNSTFVSMGATIGTGCKLKNCQIAPDTTVEANTEASDKAFGDVVVDDDDDDDIDLGDDITFE